MITVLDKSMIKQALRELIQEEPALFKKMLLEVVEDTQDADFEALIGKSFDRYAETFKALA